MAQTTLDPVSEVDPFIGTGTTSIYRFNDRTTVHDRGDTVPGAVRPFGMIDWSPDPVAGAYYDYERPETRGFSLTHMSGPGCGAFGDVPIMPILGVPRESPVGTFSGDPGPTRRTPVYTAAYSHENEHAAAGYYSVKFDSGIGVELTADVHSGMARMSFPGKTKERTILVDLSRNNTRVAGADIHIEGKRITGSVLSGGFCDAANAYRVYFVLEFQQSPQHYGTFDELHIYPGEASKTGARSGGYVSFAPSAGMIRMRAAISFVSVKNAELNLRTEIPGWDFDGVRRAGWNAWNSYLSRIQVAGGSAAQRKVFYTALYHVLLHPSVFSDVNGEYIGFDEKVHSGQPDHPHYANYSGWDIYRTEAPLIAMLFPKIGSDMAQSLVADAEQGEGLPVFPVANDDSGAMVGDPAAPILASIYAFGGRDFDTRAALKYMVRGATDPKTHSRLYIERPGLSDYLKLGYIPVDMQSHAFYAKSAAATTLEETTDDFAVSMLAKELGEADIAQRFLVRSANWRKLFDPTTRYIRPREADGEFLEGFTPSSGKGFAEGTSSQYTWMIPYNLSGVVDAIGGSQEALMRLDGYFSHYGDWHGGVYFDIGNEPSFGDPWVYNWAGQAWSTQALVRKILGDLFQPLPGGLPGNDDLGATSSWVVFANLGIYPMIPGEGGVTLTSPVFPSVVMNLGGHRLRIEAPEASQDTYIKSVALDNTQVTNNWISWKQLTSASQLTYTLSSAPAKDWGGTPPSFTP